MSTILKSHYECLDIQMVIDATDAMVIVLDRDMKIVIANKKTCSILGYSHEDIIGQYWLDNFIPQRYKEIIKNVWDGILSGNNIETLQVFENPVLTSCGGERIILWRNTLCKDDDGNILGVLASGQDVTELRQIGNQIHKLSMAIQQSPTAILMTDAIGIVQFANPSFSSLTGHKVEDVVGKNFYEVYANELPYDFKNTVHQSFAKNQTHRREFLFRKNNDITFWVGVSVSPVKGSDGNIDSQIIFMKDISDKKQVEEQRYRQTEKMAVLGRLAAGVAHEINNPLSGIILCFNKLVKSGIVTAENEKFAIAIDDGLKKIKNTVEQLLDFSKARVKEFTPKNINDILLHIMPLLEYQASKCNIVIHKDLSELPDIPLDEDKIEQVFVNLILNAIQAMSNGGRLEIQTRLHGKYCIVKIKDTGIGIPADVLPHIFEPFFTTKDLNTATGLGLSICKSIVEQHNGFISVQSTVGKGATFIIKIPLKKIIK